MKFNMQKFLDELEQEKIDVKNTYPGYSQTSYREGVLEGLRLGEIIARDAATADTMEGANLQHTTAQLRQPEEPASAS